MHAFLQRQNMNYQIFVVEQWGNATFNRAKLLNIGFLEARKVAPELGCFAFHDVDTVPEDLRLSYTCAEGDHKAKHLGVAIQKQGYRYEPCQRRENHKSDGFFQASIQPVCRWSQLAHRSSVYADERNVQPVLGLGRRGR